ncbi:hypothetical protein CPC08DRAFT_762132 [Agrocybe pediades]|nr:hypothetical protein CPC08DRAFT_762132 [Agrocybe pediades]
MRHASTLPNIKGLGTISSLARHFTRRRVASYLDLTLHLILPPPSLVLQAGFSHRSRRPCPKHPLIAAILIWSCIVCRQAPPSSIEVWEQQACGIDYKNNFNYYVELMWNANVFSQKALKTGNSKSSTADKATTPDSRGRGVRPDSEILRDLRGLHLRSQSPPIIINDQLDSRNSDNEGMIPTAPATPEAPRRYTGNALVRHETSIEDEMDVTPVLHIQSEPRVLRPPAASSADVPRAGSQWKGKAPARENALQQMLLSPRMLLTLARPRKRWSKLTS